MNGSITLAQHILGRISEGGLLISLVITTDGYQVVLTRRNETLRSKLFHERKDADRVFEQTICRHDPDELGVLLTRDAGSGAMVPYAATMESETGDRGP